MGKFQRNDIILWLHNKLGFEGVWTDSSICTQLNSDILINIKDCFLDLDSKVKLKLLLSFFYIPRGKWCTELEDILALATTDSDHWVLLLAEIMRTLPSSGTICTNFELEENRKIFNDFVKDLKLNIGNNKVPLEWCYLNKTVLDRISEPKISAVKHFDLKQQPKSELLKRSLLQKSEQPAKKKKPFYKLKNVRQVKITPSIDFNCRLMSVTDNLTKCAARKDGIKLLDFHEQPMAKKSRLLQLEETDLVTSPKEVFPEYAARLG